MDTVYFPGNRVINLVPHWADEEQELLVTLNAIGKVMDVRNGSALVQWTLPEKTGVCTTVPRTQIDLVA